MFFTLHFLQSKGEPTNAAVLRAMRTVSPFSDDYIDGMIHRKQQSAFDWFLSNSMQLHTPDTLIAQRYRITRLLGSSGTSAVYAAVDTTTGTAVALKQNGWPRQHKAWLKTARQLSHLNHPNLPRVTDVLNVRNVPFLVMEYVAGEDIEDLLHSGVAFAMADVLGWADQLLDTVGYLHAQRPSMLHGAIRPRNLKIVGRRLMLLDYALLPARVPASESRRITGYLAPEVITGGQINVQSDLYSLAATLYRLLVGFPPVDAATRLALTNQGEIDPLQAAHQLNTSIPAPVGMVLQAALSCDPRERPQTAAHFQTLLSDAEAGRPPDLPTHARPQRPWLRWRGSSARATEGEQQNGGSEDPARPNVFEQYS